MKHVKIRIEFRLGEILKEKNRGVLELARVTGIGVATISRIVNNHTRGISNAVLEILCAELEIAPGDMYKIHKIKKGASNEKQISS